MKLKNTVLLALVAFLKVVCENYIAFPISAELINVVLLVLLSLVGVDVIEFRAHGTRFEKNFV